MKKPKIVVHCLVKNEENFIWYAINSVLPFVDKIMVWDNGSTDKTVEIINTINSPKIELEKHPVITREEIGHLRQEMLEKTPTNYDWLLVLDGDEIWSKKSLIKIKKYISQNSKIESIACWTRNLVGDIYHSLPLTSGNYQIAGRKGNLNLRFINLKKIPGLHASNPYGQEGYFDKENLPIQLRRGIKFINTTYFHATHLIRSSKNSNIFDRLQKYKPTFGKKINKKYIPKIFFSKKPTIVPEVTNKFNYFQQIPILYRAIIIYIKNKLKLNEY
ncbi:MAG TPA: glycosyltransferase [Spirochaetia bacterium]|nr:glycosyltransferase [Spirochaetia bacterium]